MTFFLLRVSTRTHKKEEKPLSRWKGLHINGIESFWGFAKTRLSKFRRITKNPYYYLKEREFQFNY